MPNYNDNYTRDKAIDDLQLQNNRMIFQLPNTESGTALPSTNPVFFCQSGCAIDYHFSSIKSCELNNDGRKKFTITPTDTENINYIMWNGTDMETGEKMVQYTLKEVYFTAPAKDYIGTNTDILNQSIQYYFVFVNEKYSNLMICLSIIGSANNVGNAPKSNGFIMMETLSSRIPSASSKTDLGNLNNFNLGELIPKNKPFFSTLITNNIQYIILTEIVDIPVNFFTNMVSKVYGGMDLYRNKMTEFKRNIPKNPDTTILFYNENSQLLDNQNLVCNSDCDLVPTKKITPSIGTYISTQSEKKPREAEKTLSGAEFAPEKCEMEEVWSNQTIKEKKVKDPSKPDLDTSKLDDKDPNVVIAITVSIMIALVIITLYVFFKYTNKNKLSIIILVIGLVSLIIGLSVGCGIYTQYPQTYIISYIVGAIIWVISLFILAKYKNYDSNGYGSNYTSFNSEIPPQINNKQKPYSGVNVPTGFNQPKQSFFGKTLSRSSDSKPMTGYSPQITVPSATNTQPKQSFFGKMFSKSPESTATVPSSITVPQSSTTTASVPSATNTQPKQSFFGKMFAKSPESTATVPSSITVPQSSTTTASVPSTTPPSKSFFSKLKDTFSRKPDSSSSTTTANSAPSPITNPIVNKVSDLIKRISAEPNNKINPNKKRSLINKLNRISKNPSTAEEILNAVSRELNTK